ncbi:helix-turn-helix domain-containing protein [Streptomyces sp. TG1A-8]|uniref:helix-turn-helix domain-containing protein n=1 Tax=Streptomyces sp. TG1A-8 TaxID=3051385 RepID=UPI00265C0015|nr:helix-turn-helix domain-containing protein [Streptomyces sp. TG1A-8]MDO0926134.1 helix-turn-helix domain-containing protein [Streptomyces sp. TG1A-8]
MTESPAHPLPPPGERRRLRKAASLTRAQLAERIGVDRAAVRAWETGRAAPAGPRGEAYARLLAGLAQPGTGRAGPATAPSAWAPAPGGRGDAQRPAAVGGGATGPAGVPSLTPAQAFDALHAFCTPALVRQTYLLTGRRGLARESVERAFHLAWQRWPEVARDRDPAGWVRAAAYEYALSPWHRFRPRHRHPEPQPADPAHRALLDALLRLPPSYRRTLVLYDGVGLDLPETAAETEASTPAAANRLIHAREAVAARLPELADPAVLHRRLVELASAERTHAVRPQPVRTRAERRSVLWTRAAVAATCAIGGATTLTLRTAPTHYEAPLAPARAVHGVPPPAAMGPLSHEELSLREKLRHEDGGGPQRLLPLPG